MKSIQIIKEEKKNMVASSHRRSLFVSQKSIPIPTAFNLFDHQIFGFFFQLVAQMFWNRVGEFNETLLPQVLGQVDCQV